MSVNVYVIYMIIHCHYKAYLFRLYQYKRTPQT